MFPISEELLFRLVLLLHTLKLSLLILIVPLHT
jgi:hypothetical protein